MLNFALCDDNECVLSRLSKMLESLFIKHNFDCNVTFTSVDPNSFLAYVLNNHVDVVFLDKFKQLIRYADRQNTPFVIIIGDDEVEKGTAILKDMRTGKQTEVTIDNVLDVYEKAR